MDLHKIAIGIAILVVSVSLNADESFHASELTRELIPEVQPAVAKAVGERFGNPSEPVIGTELPVDKIAIAGRAVYEKHCVRCHGGSGDGQGAQAGEFEPRPRDFRWGIFKWKSNKPSSKPLRHDLRETLRLGVPQTGMPSFDKLPQPDIDAVVEYVRWLAMAGHFERRVALEVSAAGFSVKEVAERLRAAERRQAILAEAARFVKQELPGTASDVVRDIADQWKKSELEANIVRPKQPPTAYSDESVRRGKNLFLSEKVECYLCHGREGKGDGEHTRALWPIPGSDPPKNYAEIGLHDAWGNLQAVWDLNEGTYRGGDAPDDLYRRIVEGIPGTTMPGFSTVLREREVWDVINFLQSLRPEKLRGKSTTPRRPAPPGAKE